VVEQAEIRRRILAAKALAADIGTWDRLAEVTEISSSTLKKLGTKRGRAEEKHLLPISRACKVPYAWFTVPDVGAAVRLDDEEPSVLERLEAVEQKVETLLRRDSPTPPPPAPQGAGDPPPAPEGELGRRLQERATTSADRGQPGSAPEADSAPDSAG